MLAAAGQPEGPWRTWSARSRATSSRFERFHDRADLEQQLLAWLEEVDLQRPSGNQPDPGRTNEGRAGSLSRLPIRPTEYPLRVPVTVRTTGFVEPEGIGYSMPPGPISIPGTLFLYPEQVRIVARDGTQVEHPRTRRSDERRIVAGTAWPSWRRSTASRANSSETPRDPGIGAVGGISADRVGAPAADELEGPGRALRDLLLEYGPRRTLGAIEHALSNGRMT